MGAAGGLRGVMEVTPYGSDRNFGGWRHREALDCRSPLLGQKKTKKRLKQQSSGMVGRVGVVGSAQGVMEVTPFAPGTTGTTVSDFGGAGWL